ncbi:SDR family NAD(P)-dependent oxidoreductase [Acanthopleuribacter pedis]|uniref:SDR family NAD(P)-dependent oxidoreductase n=1 Tax=Acanthopleuribacter pedis TaxID=442870 RepID=A0A8J7Q668_9BACT|nr:SDR family NAD(P)-dependent oxidoreductase [Acanthopleuribacter pedis]MBO1317389.1 SDR family NAD(P)-dependent oxidoreductase [Acanthopleuribacter pedis]
MSDIIVISGFNQGLGSECAARLLARGDRVFGLSRSGRTLATPHARFHAETCDLTSETAVQETFLRIKKDFGAPGVLIHNAARLLLDDFTQIGTEAFEAVLRTNVTSAFLCAQAVLPDMLAAGKGTLIFSGATASVKAGARSGAFAASKFALRGMAQSLARAYQKQGIHVVHPIIDGVIWGERAEKVFGMDRNACIAPAHLADIYLNLIEQPRSCWTHELDIRPALEVF